MTETAFGPSDGAAFAVALLNTWDELEPDPECLRDLGVRATPPDPARSRRRGPRRPCGGRRLAPRPRERLARAWDAANEETAVAELNTILAGASAQPWLARDAGGCAVPLRPARRAGQGVRRRPRRPRAARGDRGRAAGTGSAGATRGRAAASSSTGRGAACGATAAGSAPTGRRIRLSGAAAPAPNFASVIPSIPFDV